MLVLARRVSQKIVIGKPGDVLTEPIVIEVVEFRDCGTTVRLGLNAQRDVGIRRGEISERQWEELKAARNAEQAAADGE